MENPNDLDLIFAHCLEQCEGAGDYRERLREFEGAGFDMSDLACSMKIYFEIEAILKSRLREIPVAKRTKMLLGVAKRLMNTVEDHYLPASVMFNDRIREEDSV